MPGLKLAFTKDRKLLFLDRNLRPFFSLLLEISKVSEERLLKRTGLGRGSMKVPFGWILCPDAEPRLGELGFLPDRL